MNENPGVIPAQTGPLDDRRAGVHRGDITLPPQALIPFSRAWTEAESFAYCSSLTQGHYENFPVGSFLIPAKLQPAVHSLYAFMRTADDFSDENRVPGDDAERLAYLESWERMLSACEKGDARHPIFVALRVTLQRHSLPVQWLHDLLAAFKMDCTVRRYETFNDVLGYCRLSANPVGRLILTLFGYRDEALYKLSDSVCTGLQLANHWQDVAVDLQKDRIYVPQEDLRRFGVDNLTERREAGRGPFQEMMAFEVARTYGLFDQGRELPEKVKGRLKWELGLTWQGGVRILDKIKAVDYDVFRKRPVMRSWDWVKAALAAAF